MDKKGRAGKATFLLGGTIAPNPKAGSWEGALDFRKQILLTESRKSASDSGPDITVEIRTDQKIP